MDIHMDIIWLYDWISNRGPCALGAHMVVGTWLVAILLGTATRGHDMTDMMDALDMTTAELVEDEACVNCTDLDAPHHVEGWGNLCPECYEGMMDVQQEQRQGYYYR